jgi:uncharacterized protein YqgV (UPF0045/DUF77 family)
MSVLFEFAMFTTDKGESISAYVSIILKVIYATTSSYKLTPMGTIVEVETFDEALSLINRAYQELESDCGRIYSTITFDYEREKVEGSCKKSNPWRKK